MDLLLFDQTEYQRLYNCTMYEIDQVPLAKRQHIALGVMFLCLGIICEVLYVPCMIAIRKHMDSTCYKKCAEKYWQTRERHNGVSVSHSPRVLAATFMFYIAIADMMCLVLCGIVTGYLAIIGAVFCTAPTFIYISGSLALVLWVTETTAEMILAFNRCVELGSSWLAELLFRGKRIYLWMALPTVYGLYFLMFTKPMIFNGIYITWFQNPHTGYIESYDGTYRNSMQSVHDVIVVTVLPSIYLLFALILCIKSRKVNAASTNTTSQKSIFLQVVLISCVNAMASAIYVSMGFVPLSELLILVGQFCWLMAHGIPPFIYLLLNKTVRHDVFLMLVHPIVMLCPCIPLLKKGQSTPAAAVATLRTVETNNNNNTTKIVGSQQCNNRVHPLPSPTPIMAA